MVNANGEVVSTNFQDWFGMVDPYSSPTPWWLKPAYAAFKNLPKQ